MSKGTLVGISEGLSRFARGRMVVRTDLIARRPRNSARHWNLWFIFAEKLREMHAGAVSTEGKLLVLMAIGEKSGIHVELHPLVETRTDQEIGDMRLVLLFFI